MTKKKIRSRIMVYTTLFILFINYLQFIPVKADGSVDAQEVWAEWRTDEWVGGSSSNNDKKSIDGSTQATYVDSAFNFTNLNIDYVNVTHIRAYIYWYETNDAFYRDWYVSAWNYVGQEDAGARVQTETWLLQNYDGTGSTWVTRALTYPWNFTADAFFFGISCEDMGGNVYVYQWESAPSSDSWLYDKDNHAPDPFIEDWGTATGESDDIQIIYAGYRNQLTTYNQYVGDTKDFIARRDFNYTFPFNVVNKKIRITLPNSEHLLNITRSNNGLWDEELSSSEYTIGEFNGTHQVITINNTPLSLYGGDYRLYSSSRKYCYTFNGLFIENGTKYGNVNVTVYIPSNTSTHMIDGKEIIGFDDKPIQITWSLSGGGIRRIYAYDNTEEIWFFTPDDDYASYSFAIRDYTDSIGSGESYLESVRVINDTEKIIERALILDTINPVPIILTKNQMYTLNARLPDGTIYKFIDFLPESDYAPTLTIRGISISKSIQPIARWVSLEATRPNSNQIQINYEDKMEKTVWINMKISFRNGTETWSYATMSNKLQCNWYSAENITDYVVSADITHGEHGDIEYSTLLMGEYEEFEEGPDVDWAGTWPIKSTYFFSLIIIFSIAGAGSKISAFTAIILAIAATTALDHLGWIPIPDIIIGVSWGFALLWAIGERIR